MPVTVDRSLRLPEDEYFAVARHKSGIAIHHTVGGTAESTFRGWRADRTDNGRRKLDGLGRLVDELCGRFAIPRQYPDPPFDYYGDALIEFEGVIGHAMVRSDKSDPAPDPRLWETLARLAALRPVPVTPRARANGAGPMTAAARRTAETRR